MIFECTNNVKGKNVTWSGRIESLKCYGNYYEMVIESSSRIHVLFGKTELGGFACMPDFGVSCHIADLDSYAWNREELISVLGRVDGITVATALKALADRISYAGSCLIGG